MNKMRKILALVLVLSMTAALLAGCGGSGKTETANSTASAPAEAVPESYTFPLAEKAEISGLTRYAAGTESEPNNRTIYKRLEEATNVHVNWKTIQGDQWADKIALEMANIKTLPEFVSPAGLSDTDILKYAKQGVIIPLEQYIDKYMPNLQKVFEQASRLLSTAPCAPTRTATSGLCPGSSSSATARPPSRPSATCPSSMSHGSTSSA